MMTPRAPVTASHSCSLKATSRSGGGVEGFRVQGFRDLGFRGLGFRGLGWRVHGFDLPEVESTLN